VPSKSHMEKVLREEGWKPAPRFIGHGWYKDPSFPKFRYWDSAGPIALRRRQARERRELRKAGWVQTGCPAFGLWQIPISPGCYWGPYTREEAIQLERGRHG
jgi:hypothetical protein